MRMQLTITLSLKTKTSTRSKIPDLNSAVTGFPVGLANISLEF